MLNRLLFWRVFCWPSKITTWSNVGCEDLKGIPLLTGCLCSLLIWHGPLCGCLLVSWLLQRCPNWEFLPPSIPPPALNPFHPLPFCALLALEKNSKSTTHQWFRRLAIQKLIDNKIFYCLTNKPNSKAFVIECFKTICGKTAKYELGCFSIGGSQLYI